MKLSTIFKLLKYWPPYLGAGISAAQASDDCRSVDVQMKLRFWNKNYVGTHFGGSLYSMTDPFIMLMLLHNLGKDYIVWDKTGTIHYKKPSKETVKAKFRLTDEQLQEIRHQTSSGKKYEPTFKIPIVDTSGEVIAEVEKVLYIRKKDRA